MHRKISWIYIISIWFCKKAFFTGKSIGSNSVIYWCFHKSCSVQYFFRKPLVCLFLIQLFFTLFINVLQNQQNFRLLQFVRTSKLTIQLFLWSLISSCIMCLYSSRRCNSLVIISINSNPALRIVSVELHFCISL